MKSLLIAALLLLNVSAVAQKSESGMWWRGLSVEERNEFLAGYIDCYANDLGDKNGTFPESWYTYAGRVTEYYERHPNAADEPVTSILFKVVSKHVPSPSSGGEVWTEKHWFFDGSYWGQLSRNDAVAFVDGYVACFDEHLADRRSQKFTKSASAYQQAISDWYEASPAKREKTAIADVLYKLADR